MRLRCTTGSASLFVATLLLAGALTATRALAADTCGPIAPGTTSTKFDIHGTLIAPAGLFDWYAGPGGFGVIQSGSHCGVPDPVGDGGTTLFVQDSVSASVGGDVTTFGPGSNTNEQFIDAADSPYTYGHGTTPGKDDLTETYVHFTPPDQNGNRWLIVGAAYGSTNGDKHFDFEFNQRGVHLDPTQNLIIGDGPDKGRTAGVNGDFVVSIDYQQGGNAPCVHLRQWTKVGTSFQYVPVFVGSRGCAVNGDTSYSAVSPANTPVPCPVFSTSGTTRTDHYEALQFAEGAINLTCFLPFFDPNVFCNAVSTVFVKTRSSGSSGFDGAQLKDFVLAPFQFIQPPPCSINDPGPQCVGVAFQLCGPSDAGLSYSWTGPGIPAGEGSGQCIHPTVTTAGTATYSLHVSNGAGCGHDCSRDVSVSQVSLTLQGTAPSCHNGTDGKVQATFSGGTSPYSISIDNGAAVANATSPYTFSNLGSGSHSVTVTDKNNCAATQSTTLGNPTAVTLDLTPTGVSCHDGTDGKIQAAFGGGTSPYSISIDGGSAQTNATSPVTFSSLGAGSHSVTVTDNNGCTLTKSATVGNPDALSLSLTPTNGACGGSGASIQATFSGGTGTLQVRIDSGTFSAQTSPYTFTGLGAGSHTVELKDANGCTTSQSASVSIATCGAQVTPTNTTCTDFTTGVAQTLSQVCYGVKSGAINNVAPGVFFYYTRVTATTANFTINIVQTNDTPGFPYFPIQQSQVFLYDANCNKIGTGTQTSTGQGSVNVTGATNGQVFIVAVKYSANGLSGISLGSSRPKVHYDFKTQVGGTTVDQSANGLDFSNCVGNTVVSTAPIPPAVSIGTTPGETDGLELYRPTPNPFVQSMRLAYAVSNSGDPVDIGVYDLAGRLVRTLVTGPASAGNHVATWDGRDEQGARMKNGVYFIRAMIADQPRLIRVAILR